MFRNGCFSLERKTTNRRRQEPEVACDNREQDLNAEFTNPNCNKISSSLPSSFHSFPLVFYVIVEMAINLTRARDIQQSVCVCVCVCVRVRVCVRVTWLALVWNLLLLFGVRIENQEIRTKP